MPLTPEQKAKIQKKDIEMPDALKRSDRTNYRQGWFFVTLNTRNEAPILSTCVGDPNVPDGRPSAPHCEYSELGKQVLACWERMPAIHPAVDVDLCEAMPEHFHGLVHLQPDNKRHLGSLISGFMGGCTHAYWDALGIDWHTNRFDQGASALKIDRDRDHTHSLRGPALFVHGYNDVEALTEEQVEVKRAYIRDQARKRLIKGRKSDCFMIFRNQHSAHWTAEVVQQAVGADPFFARNRDKGIVAYMKVAERLNGGNDLCLDYLGDRRIMAASRKLPLVCHRADAARFDKQCAAVMREARAGAVIVSAFISPKEREIRDQLLGELLPVVQIMDNGFADRYKPIGKSFYACAENRLVQITPWKYVYQKEGAQVSREMCLVMNELARVITGVGDSWWKLPQP